MRRPGLSLVLLAALGALAGLTSATAGPETVDPAAHAAPGSTLHPPTRLMVAGKPLDVDTGHAAPAVLDWDGDGVRDLLVGQFGDGKLRIFKNFGSDAAPRFYGFEYFRAGGEDGTIPSG